VAGGSSSLSPGCGRAVPAYSEGRVFVVVPERHSVQDAADILGITTGAVRSRLSRGTLQSVKEGGTVYVLLPAGTHRHAARDATDMPDESSALMSEMRDRIAFLERELERKDAILLNMTEAMKAIAPPAQEESSEPREAPVTATEEMREARPASGGAQEGAKRPWWRRWFGG
jgi:hypothetical protein